jgi:WD40 repeat protein
VWSPTGSTIASASNDGTIKLWNTTTGECDSTLNGHSRYVTSVSYSCLFSNVWCVLTIEHFTAQSRVFPSVVTANKLLVEAMTTP